MATIYVDPAGSNTSPYDTWAKARTTLPTSGVSAGDTVYISGGTTYQTYILSSTWSPQGGTSGNKITYKVGQDAGHNGIVYLDGNGTLTGPAISLSSYTILDGEVSGSRHIEITNMNGGYMVNGGSTTGVKMTYITIPDEVHFYAARSYEISYCYIDTGNAVGALRFDEASPVLQGLHASSIHHNYFRLSQLSDASGNGADGIMWVYSCDIYNNSFVGNENGLGDNHQDGIQTGVGQLRIYNNYFENLGNYPIFMDCFGSLDDVQIYNNEIQYTDSKWSSGLQQGIAIGRDGGASGTLYFTNIVVANNTGVHIGTGLVRMTESSQAIWDNTSYAYNNMAYACPGGNTIPSIVNDGNNVQTSSGGTNIFIDYKALGSGTSDLHLKGTDTVCKDQGTSMATYFTTDKDGNARTGTWDIGAYEYGATPATFRLPIHWIIS